MHTPCPPGWHFIHMDILQESVNQPINYLSRIIPLGWTLPSAIEVVLMLFLRYLTSAEQLLTRKHTWCSDPASLGRFVTVGAFGKNGVFISAHPTGYVSRGLGICPKVAS